MARAGPDALRLGSRWPAGPAARRPARPSPGPRAGRRARVRASWGLLFLDQDSPGGMSTDAYREPVGHVHAHSGDSALAALPLDTFGRAHTDSGNSGSPGWSRSCSMGVFRRPSPEVGP